MRRLLAAGALIAAAPLAAFLAFALTSPLYNVPEGVEFYTDRLRHLPEARLFLEAYPDAEPAWTGRYATGFASAGETRTELSIHHARFSFEPDLVVIDCYHSDSHGVEAYLADLIETSRCGTGYPEGHGFYTENARALPGVQAFLERFPGAEAGYTSRHTAGFVAREGGVVAEAILLHERFDPDPGRVVFDCYPEGARGSISPASEAACAGLGG